MKVFQKELGLRVSRAFTLVELLVVMAIIAILTGLLLMVIGRVKESGNQAREINAGRQLIAAYITAAGDRDGELMVAHYEGRADEVNLGATHPDGSPLSTAELHRYPFRLIPYLENQIDGTILAGQNAEQIRKKFTRSQFNYGVSLCPSFGINYYFVGGYKVDNVLQGEWECATRLAQVEKPASLLVFATAFCKVEGDRIAGRFGIVPPNYRTPLWDENLYVDPRHGGKVLCAFLDGSLRFYTVDQLRDMRLWSKNAANVDDEYYRVAAAGSGGIGGGGRR